jgi:hypothetical protein
MLADSAKSSAESLDFVAFNCDEEQAAVRQVDRFESKNSPPGVFPPISEHLALKVGDALPMTPDGKMAMRRGDDTLVVGAGHWVSMPRVCRIPSV